MSDPRPEDAEADGTGPGQGAGPGDGRLVLTSALRVSDGPPGPAVGGGTGPVTPDEAALRLLVQTILREELAGPLGERITRGVRKLVRAEVAALMSARDPE